MKARKYIYVCLMGGIGDQIFQFSFANYLRAKLNCKIYLDICYYKSKSNYNQYKFLLNKAAAKKNFCIVRKTSFLDYKFLSYLRIFDILKIDTVFKNIYNYFFKTKIKKFIYDYWKENIETNITYNSFYFGYWHKIKFVKDTKDHLYKFFISEILKKKKIKNFIENKINSKTVAIHIRGGDFAQYKTHNLLSQNYYDNAIKHISKKIIKPNFHVFTNDINLAYNLLKKYSSKYKILYIKKFNFRDEEEFSLFSTYKLAIIANSTFSYMSSYLSNTRKISLAPKIWLLGKRLDKNKIFKGLHFI